MRILIVTQYFWPESFRINDLVIGLKERGHEVIVLTGKPNYPAGKFYNGYGFFKRSYEVWNNIKIYRSPLIARGKGGAAQLFLNYLSFALFAIFRVFYIRDKPDCIFVYEPSPVSVGIPAIVAKLRFKVPIFFWVQDIWPHSIKSAGNINNEFLIRIIDGLTRWIYKGCDKILIQSEAFSKIILRQNVLSEKLFYFPNWSEEYYVPLNKNEKYRTFFKGEYNFVFAGNIGEAQDFDTLLQAALIVRKHRKDVHWVIIGDGRMRNEVINKARSLGVEDCFDLIGSFPSEEMPEFFSHATALIVSLKEDPIFSITIPSKIQSYLACGKPIITSLDGEGSRIVTEAKAGISCRASSPDQLAKTILHFVDLPDIMREEMGKAGREYYEKVFDRNMLIDRLINLMKQ